ncbi:MAG: sulfite exporter TauE/SafE family protein [Gemmatimonadaceae bacterium]
MIETALGVLTASVLGSVHCAGMCGPFVCFYTGSASRESNSLSTMQRAVMHTHVLYNVGRLISYLLLGAIAGAMGSGITQAGGLAGVANGAALLAGVLMLAWGLHRVAALRGIRIRAWPTSTLPLAMQKMMGNVLLKVKAQSPGARALVTGLVTTLLPCGWLYVFVVAAGGTGSAVRGMVLMAVFWLGNVPAMLAVGIGVQRAFGPLQRTLPMLSAITVTALGMFAVVQHFRMATMSMLHAH